MEENNAFSEAIEYFSEDAVKSENLLNEAHRKQNMGVGPNATVPFADLSDLSAEKKAIIGRYLANKRDRALKQENGAEAGQEKLSLCAAPVQCEPALLPSSFGQGVGIIRDLIRLRQKDGQGTEASLYDFMRAILNQIRLANYNGTFYYQDGSVFRQVSDQDLRAFIFSVIEPALALGKTPRTIGSIMDLLRDYPCIRVCETTETPDRVFFLNGAYDLTRHELLPPLNSDFVISYIPVQYNPNDRACPVFDSFLLSISGGDPAIMSLIWEVIGYLLSNDMAAKSFFLLLGVGDSGKSVLGNLISSMFNPEAVSSLDIYRFKGQFATSALKGKRLNICMDLPRAQISREAIGVIKMLTGDDTITIEQKFKDSESYKPKCKLLFGSNFPLMPADNDAAFRARLVTIPFLYPIPKERQDKHLLEKLKAERCAIAVKALDAYLHLKARNYQFTKVEGGTAATVGYIPDSELMQAFLRDCCVISPDAYAFTADLHEAYNQFRAARNVPPIMDPSIFSRQLNRLCGEWITPKRRRIGGQNLNGYEGIGLRQAPGEGRHAGTPNS